MLEVDRWSIFYGDGSTFSSDDGMWADAPPFGVFAVVYYDVRGRRLVHMEQQDRSEYRWPVEHVSVPEGAVEVHGVEVSGSPVKYGLWVDSETYYALFDAVHGEVMP